MAHDAFQLASGAAAIYEQQKVSAVFRPLAEATLDAIEVSRRDAVLDVACGTGIVARVVHERISPNVPITGVDLNQGMIEKARELTSDAGDDFRWHVANATDMPFVDGVFTVAICQQGLQFMPDEAATLREMRRVLQAKGLLVLTVWAGASRFFRALAQAIGNHVSQEDAELSLAPFAYGGFDGLPALLGAGGFADVRVRDLSVERLIRDPETAIPREIMSNPVGPAVAARGEDVMTSIVDEVLAGCADMRRGTDLVAPQTARLVTARAV